MECFLIFLGSNGGVDQVAPSALKVINTKATFVLKGLEPNGNYSIMLTAQTGEGDGPVSLPIFCPTKPSGKFLFYKNVSNLYKSLEMTCFSLDRNIWRLCLKSVNKTVQILAPANLKSATSFQKHFLNA